MRLDKYLTEKGFTSRTKAARAIEKGLVTVNGKAAKASLEVTESDCVCVRKEEVNFVSEGGYKLFKALGDFGDEVAGMVFADIGASTGGFTDCLLQAGAARVFAVDVGESQLDARLASDSRVTIMDRTNARYLTGGEFSPQPDGLTADVSFISLCLILPAASKIVRPGGRAYVLIKPQFECGAAHLDKHGIVKDASARLAAVQKVCECAEREGFSLQAITNAPLHKGKNVEYILKLGKGGGSLPIDRILQRAEQLT